MALPKLKSPFDLVRYFLHARRQPHSKSIGRQLRELVSLRRGRNRLGFSEYFDYSLYDHDRFPDDVARTFVGYKVDGPLMEAVNSFKWRAADEDKLLFSTLLHMFGLPHPKLYAFYWTRARPTLNGVPCIVNPEEMIDFLRERMPYPCFSKPVDGYRSVGAVAITDYDRAQDSLVFLDGTRQRVPDFVKALPAPYKQTEPRVFHGHLFQELLRPSREVLDIVPATGLSTLRLVLLCDTDPPELFRSVWKIPMEGNMADNFWRQGNLLVDIDPNSGILGRAIRSLNDGFETVADERSDKFHLAGKRVPNWEAAVAACQQAASLFPETHCQHWDVALCDQGPILIELNAIGDLALIQSVSRSGVLDQRFDTFLQRMRVIWDRDGPRAPRP